MSWLPGTPGAGGWRELTAGPVPDRTGTSPRGATLLTLAHLSDLHLCDAASPARQEYLDHFGDPDSPWAGRLPEIGTYRPQEILTLQVAAAALAAIGRTARGPVTGAPLDAVLVTGDATDNAQSNELGWYATLMAGGTATADARDWVGSRGSSRWFWHPDGSDEPDRPTSAYGYPRAPGLVAAASEPVHSPGLPVPWFGVHGNHDALLQGVVAPDAELNALATGARRVVDLAPTQTPLVVTEAVAAIGPARYTHQPDSPTEPIRPDRTRAFVTPGQFAAAQATAGAGGTPGPGNSWSADVGEVRLLAIDTVNPHGGWQGSIDEAQLDWLDRRLAEAAGGYVILTSHHPSWTLVNGYAPAGAGRRVLADELLRLLLRHTGVVAWIAGHVHAHTSLWHPRPAALGPAGGFWEITTSSLIDWPQQGRVLELVREADGLALASTVIDHLGTPGPLDSPLALAGLSRTLAVNDYRARDGLLAAAAGRLQDRDTVWRLPDPGHRLR
ncbi:MAG: metallophosphoesterase [Actinobacteria bacterium]|nr:metallophosphoesterase [Actinomycetota bacterium]MCG2801182.1 metallophosphoesterase [Cellulomonas sp.]